MRSNDISKSGLFSGSKAGDLPKIYADQLMISNIKSYSKHWGNNQALWGKLTFASIKMTEEKINNKELTSLIQIFQFLKKCRKLIAVILHHRGDFGIERKAGAETPISDHPESPFKDQVTEFSRLFDDLVGIAKSNENETLEVKEDKYSVVIKQSAVFNHKEKSNLLPLTYVRKLKNSSGQFSLQHMGSPLVFLLAQDLYEQLELAKDEPQKKKLLAEITHLVAADMRLCRGNASVTKMLYYVLEHVYLGQYTYFRNKAGSVAFDLAAMLMDSERFYTYFTKSNLDESVRIEEPPQEKIQVISQETRKVLSDMIDDVEKFRVILDGSKYSCLSEFREGELEKFQASLKFMNKTFSQSNDAVKSHIQVFLSALLEKIPEEISFYSIFCNKVKTKSEVWPKPRFQEFEKSSLKDFEKIRHDLERLIESILNLGGIMRRHYAAFDMSCNPMKNLKGIASYLSDPACIDSEGSQYAAIGIMKRFSNQSALKVVMPPILNTLKALYQLKQSNPGKQDKNRAIEFIAQPYRPTCGKPIPGYLRILHRDLNAMYANIEAIKERFEASYDVWQALVADLKPINEIFSDKSMAENLRDEVLDQALQGSRFGF